MKKVLVIGGGLAGLTSAVYLTKNNFRVTLLEASPKLGGRAYSFYDEDLKTEIDNGQHIMLGCYKDTLQLLRITEALDGIKFQESLEINYLGRNNKRFSLSAKRKFYPFNLIAGLFSFKGLQLSEKLSLAKFFVKIKFTDPDNLSDMNVNQWLKNEKQSENAIKIFWEIISVGALNTSTERASAKIFCEILKEIFWKDDNSYMIILPRFPLTKCIIEPLQRFIIKNGGEIKLSEKCVELIIENERISALKTDKAFFKDFDFVISAIPDFALRKLLNEKYSLALPDFRHSSILNIHLLLRNNFLKKDFYAFENSELHWLFNKGTHWNIVISNADKFIDSGGDEIYKFVMNELKQFLQLNDEDVVLYKVIKEKRATFIPDQKVLSARPSTKTNIKNLYLAGDWVNTKLPATIESAVKSGRMAAEEIIFQQTSKE